MITSFGVLHVLHRNGSFCAGFHFLQKIFSLPQYNGIMARPTKITNEKKLKLADFIRSGLTIKDACYGVGISPSTFNRLRAKDPAFDKLINEATEGGWTNAESLAKYHYRGYKRKIPHKYLAQLQKPLTEALNAPQTHNIVVGEHQDRPKRYLGLPVRFTYPETRPSDYYYNGNTHRIERFTRDGILQSMSIRTWRHKYLGMADDPLFFGTIF